MKLIYFSLCATIDFNLNSDVMPHDGSDVIKRDFRPNCVEFEIRVSMPESIFNFIDDFDCKLDNADQTK